MKAIYDFQKIGIKLRALFILMILLASFNQLSAQQVDVLTFITSPASPICAGTNLTVSGTASATTTADSYRLQLDGPGYSSILSYTYVSITPSTPFAYTGEFVNFISPGGTFTLTVTTYNATVPSGDAAGTATTTITVTAPQTATAGIVTPVCYPDAATLAGNTPGSGTGAWSFTSGPGTLTFGNASSGTSTVTATVAGTYVATWTITNAPCAASTATSSVTFTAPQTATIDPITTVCYPSAASLVGSTPISPATGAWSQEGGAGELAFGTGTSSTSTVTATVAGTYVVKWTISNIPCDASTATRSVTFTAPQTATIDPITTVCYPSAASLVGSTFSSPATGLWTKDSGTGELAFGTATSNTSTVTATVAGTYVVKWTITNGACGSSTATSSVTFTAPQTATIDPITTVCYPSAASLVGSTPISPATGAWSQEGGAGELAFGTGTSSTSTVTATVAGTYVVKWTISNIPCDASTATRSVTFTAPPTTATAGAVTTVCTSNITTLIGNNPTVGTGTWTQTSGPGTLIFSNANAYNSTVTASVAGTYVATWTIANAPCTASTATCSITFLPRPTASFTATPNPLCMGSPLTLTSTSSLTSGMIYNWVGPTSSGVNLTVVYPTYWATIGEVTANHTGIYTLTVTDPITECTGTTTMTVTVNELPTVVVSGGGPVCAGNSANVTFTFTPSGAATRILTYTDGTTPVTVTTSANPYIVSLSPASTKTYTATALSDPFCSAVAGGMTGSATITVNSLPTAYNVTGGGSLCAGGTGVVIGLSGSQTGVNYYLKLSGTTIETKAGTGSALSFAALTVAGTYSVTATNATTSCENVMTGSATITVNPLPTAFTVTGGGSYCAGGTGVVIGLPSSESGVNYSLKHGGSTVTTIPGTGSAISFGLQTAAGTYTVTAINATTSCVNDMTGSATITINALPTATITPGGPTTFCTGGSVVLTASTGFSYLWSNGETTQAITATVSGNYTVTVSDGTCSATSTPTTVTVVESTTINLQPVDQSICAGQTATYTVGYTPALPIPTDIQWYEQTVPGGPYDILPESGKYSGTGTVTLTITGVTTSMNGYRYLCRVTGCSSVQVSTSALLTVNTVPAAIISASGPTTFCQGGSVTLSAPTGTGYTYLWSNGLTTQSFTVTVVGSLVDEQIPFVTVTV